MATLPKSLTVGLVLDTSLDPMDGVQQYVVAIGEWLRAQGHDVHYLVGETHQRPLPNVHSLARNITVRFNGNRTTIPLPTSRRKLQHFLQEHHFDVLHVQTPHHPLMAQRLIMAAPADTAVIGTFHILPYGRVASIGNRLLGLWLRPSLRRFDRLLAVSPAAARFARQSFRMTAEVSPNVVNYALYHIAAPFKQYDDDIPTILFLGRLVPRKGCMVLLQAAARLKQLPDVPAFRLVICGRGALEADLKRYVARHNLTDNVEFTGYVSEEDKPRYYASADIAVFPSRGGESFGIVLLEAMANGQTAVLAGDNPGYRSVMEPAPQSLFDPRNSKALADKLLGLLQESQSRQALADWGSKHVQAFDVNVVGQQLLQIYDEALRKRRGL